MDGILAVKSKEEGQRAARRRMLSESGVWMARVGRVGNDASDRQTARSAIFDDIYRNRGAQRQQLAALETTVEETK